jgi:hypothetical protein
LDLAPVVAGGTLEDALDAVLDAVRRHVPDGQLTDDLAVLLLERVSTGRPAQVGSVRNQAGSVSASAAPDESTLSAR